MGKKHEIFINLQNYFSLKFSLNGKKVELQLFKKIGIVQQIKAYFFSSSSHHIYIGYEPI